MVIHSPYQSPELLQQLAAGDERALHILYNECYASLLFFAENLVHQKEQAEDIVIVAFTRYWDRRQRFDSLPGIKSFLYKVVQNDCYKFYHQQQARERRLQQVQEAQMPATEDFAESRMVIAEMVQHIHREIERLNPKYRDVIYLLFVEELSVQEAAVKLQLTPENVRKRKERAIALLRNTVVRSNLSNLALFYLVLHEKMQ